MTTTQSIAGLGDYQVDVEFDFASEDESGYLWTWLDHARDPAQIVPGAVLTMRDGEDLAMGQVVDLADEANGTVVHIRLLPGAVEDYHAAIARATLHRT